MEIQIRTRQMHLVAEYGIAAHYQYKEGGRVENELERKLGEFLVRGTTEWQAEAENPREFMDLLRVALYQDEVFVFTPRGELKQLPRGATPHRLRLRRAHRGGTATAWGRGSTAASSGSATS